MTLPVAGIAHELPCRLRLHVPSRRGDRAFFETAVAKLRELPGVRSVRGSPATGSVLIEHGSDTAAIAAFAAARDLFQVTYPDASGGDLVGGPAERAAPISPLTVAAAGLAGAGVYQLLRGRVLGSASENLWNAYGSYAVLRRPWLSTALVGFGLYQLTQGQGLGSAVSLFLYAFNAQRMAAGLTSETAV